MALAASSRRHKEERYTAGGTSAIARQSR